ncbi:MAG: dihydroorotate dehydrogenase (quinone) [Saprospirales bacterium]|nr:dihydroorotate dehydrogenase (quinone) [Saprospirales bacterium]|tara:strand:+ start:19628 stop:20650 length:1023 start_codon:yes stop_codon:yes gene_type:complete
MFKLAQAILFMLPAETAHYFTMNLLKVCYQIGLIRNTTQPAERLNVRGLGDDLWFNNRVGLAAGFDKNAQYVEVLYALGFAAIEVGTVTPRGQVGNPKPRLFRLKRDKALINRLGFNNDGVDAMERRLMHLRSKQASNHSLPVIGINIGKNKLTPNEQAVGDYVYCLERLHAYGDYFVVNVSSPNTPGLRALQGKDSLVELLTRLQAVNKAKGLKPLLLKVAPDLSDEALLEAATVVTELQCTGMVLTNTTISREGLITSSRSMGAIGNGGLSGDPLAVRSAEVLALIRKAYPDMTLVSVGGISSKEEGQKRLELGADFLQVYTGFVYGGPHLIKCLAEL